LIINISSSSHPKASSVSSNSSKQLVN